MSYTIEELTSIDDDIFDTLYNHSYPKIESGNTMPWERYGSVSTPEEKKVIIKQIFTEVTAAAVDNAKVYLWRKDGTPIRMTSVSVPLDDPTYLLLHYTLYGPDANNSRSWLYDADFLTEINLCYAETFGVIGHMGHVMTDSPMCIYYRNLPKSSPSYSTLTEEVSEDGLISIFKFTYT